MTEYTAWGVDYADGKGLTTAEMKANGVQFVCRYLSGGGAKDIDQEELSILLGASIAVVLNWETWGQMPSEAQGVADATAARQEAAGLGLGDAPIYFSADFDPTGKTASIDAYMRGVASVIGQERTGLYAGLAGIQAYFDAAIGKYGWQTCGWSAANGIPAPSCNSGISIIKWVQQRWTRIARRPSITDRFPVRQPQRQVRTLTCPLSHPTVWCRCRSSPAASRISRSLLTPLPGRFHCG